ncbi:hypothetical protein AB0F96_19570 [Streptomyces sp. NPDC023998]|uniref:hypothetical protein n=1 Tax=Streptomyces sp. NPDC023998 TaxID=3154597 RepID=UPI0033F72F28
MSPDEPFIAIVWWVNREVLHHGAEIALIRDLYRTTAESLPDSKIPYGTTFR